MAVSNLEIDRNHTKNMVYYPQKLINFIKRLSGLPSGQYIIVLNVKRDLVKYRISQMGDDEQ